MKKILIVDDQEQVRELVEVTLSGKDYEVLQADNGRRALEIVYAEKPHLVLMDIMMPGAVDGLEATRIIKDTPALSGCKVIMLTAKGQESDKNLGQQAGADGYFVKPFSPLELMNKIAEILD
ncbi:MAG: two-component system response regulator [Candidatus Riflebacteria bacterium RBG_13_59_9]|nr:MAG: two-component system response regulator [Candidatus Riflebacteria bacterium RBG_13_59_9]